MPLIARRDDRKLGDEREHAWLMRHLRSCGKCRLYAEAMRETGACYIEDPWIRAASRPAAD